MTGGVWFQQGQFTDPVSGAPRVDLIGRRGVIVEPGTTTPVPITDSAHVVVPDSVLTITGMVYRPGFWTVNGEVLVEWWDEDRGIRIPVESVTGAAEAARASAALAAEARDAMADLVEEARPVLDWYALVQGAADGEVATIATGPDGRRSLVFAPAPGGQVVQVVDNVDHMAAPGTTPTTVLVIPDGDPPAPAFAIPTGAGYVTMATGDLATPGVTVPIPAAVGVGDELHLIVGSQEGGDVTDAGWSAPDGWTEVANSLTSSGLRGRHHAEFRYRVTDPAALARLGGSVTVPAGSIRVEKRATAIMYTVQQPHAESVVGVSGYWPVSEGADHVTLPGLTASHAPGAAVAYTMTQTSSGNPGAIPAPAGDGWELLGSITHAGPGSTLPSVTTLTAWRRYTNALAVEALRVGFDPATAINPVGLQVAIRGR